MRRLIPITVALAGCGNPATSTPTTAPPPPATTTAPAPGTPAVAIAGHGVHMCMIVKGGAVMCWDGTDPDGYYKANPPSLVAGLPAATAIALGDEHACALVGAGDVWCWTASTAPTQVAVDHVVELGAAESGMCVRRDDGSIWCWGRISRDGPVVAAPREVIARGGASALAVGAWHACARLTGGDVACWGEGEVLAQGDGVYADHEMPVVVAGAGAGRLACVSGHCCVLADHGDVTCWGGVPASPMVQGSFMLTMRPKRIAGLDPLTELWCGDGVDCGRRRDGSVVCWGDAGQGNPLTGQVAGFGSELWKAPALADSAQIVVASFFGCALARTGGVSCWGMGHRDPAPIAW